MRYAIANLLFACGAVEMVFAAEKLAVTIIDRHDSESSYSYVVPGRSITNTQANADCSKVASNVNCSGGATSTTASTPAIAGTYAVSGSTMTLQLPDGRLVIVNCNNKPNHTEWTHSPVRSCRTPTIEKIEAEFDGGKAKLIWPAGIDGKKMQSETYKIITIIGAP
jgi:hypothetical protein